MQLKFLTQLLLGLSIAPIMTLALNQPSYAIQKYKCDTSEKDPITYVRKNRGWKPFIEWKSNYFANSKSHPISKRERCQIVTKRLQKYDDNQMIPYYLTAEDNLNGYPVICVVDIDRRNCSKQDVLITLQPGTDPTAVLSQIRYFNRGAVRVDRLYLSGDDVVSYNNNGNPYVDVRELTK